MPGVSPLMASVKVPVVAAASSISVTRHPQVSESGWSP